MPVNPLQITSTQALKEATANANFDSVAEAMLFAARPLSHTGLNWAFYGGDLWANGAYRTIADSTVLCTLSTTNYIGLDVEGNGTLPALTVNTSGFVDGEIPLAEVVTDATDITSEKDRRLLLNLSQLGPDIQALADAATITADALGGQVVVVGALTAARTIGAPTNPFTGARLTYLLLQDGTGSFGLTWNAIFKKSTDPTAGTANQVAATTYHYNGANWVQDGGAFAWS
jgi:hypothetical protein